MILDDVKIKLVTMGTVGVFRIFMHNKVRTIVVEMCKIEIRATLGSFDFRMK